MMVRHKECLACSTIFMVPERAPYADFCGGCYQHFLGGDCPIGPHRGHVAPRGTWADWPVMVCEVQGQPMPFAEAHPRVDPNAVRTILVEGHQARCRDRPEGWCDDCERVCNRQNPCYCCPPQGTEEGS